MLLLNRALAYYTFILSYTILSTNAWNIQDVYNADNWSQGMSLETRITNAEYVNYLAYDAATSSGLIQNRNGQLFLGVDNTTTLDPNSGIGRKSVRISTNKQYNVNTLVIGDFAHIPANICGAWPSFWMVGPAWPTDGEIDIIEGINQMPQNQITLHTRPGCVPGVGPGGESGQRTGKPDCGADNSDVGCGVFNTQAAGWGSAFNAAGGGAYAVLWAPDSIRIWYWKASDVPGDARSDNPNPDSWGAPIANFNNCDFSTYFDNMRIIINTTFCGNWAGALWKSGSCASLATECYQYVAANPQAYTEAYWLINSIKVFSP